MGERPKTILLPRLAGVDRRVRIIKRVVPRPHSVAISGPLETKKIPRRLQLLKFQSEAQLRRRRRRLAKVMKKKEGTTYEGTDDVGRATERD